ncbi:hypothetical protein SAMN05661091_3439 [Paenibacillus uliginis N3/975]|uniref:DUF2975 domain-containing protein n=1 Tax=Paenibacillus uliginis N3/975 TaxID=1313296 RepID=A0A1X7HH35_9BACL|nr:hypothetical protein [Paenibacillus uliginis]SMF86587.1 hypothetical protein SAMN05661091_3439 [Paenibacillus uliginis N3/975]
MNNNKIQRSSKLLAICLKILRIVVFIAVGVEISAIIWLAAVSEDVISTTIGSIHIFSPIVNTADYSKSELIAQFCVNITKQSIVIAMLFLAGAIFKDISREYTPFAAKQTKRLKAISKLMVLLAIIPASVEILMMQILAPTVKVYVSFELSFILVAVVFFCLAQIFDYGGVLQQQSDETL